MFIVDLRWDNAKNGLRLVVGAYGDGLKLIGGCAARWTKDHDRGPNKSCATDGAGGFLIATLARSSLLPISSTGTEAGWISSTIASAPG
jgi:hypothetical protein